MTSIVLRTERLVLRPVTAEDFAAVVGICSDARVMDPLGGALSEVDARAWLERQLRHWTDHRCGRLASSPTG